MQNPEDIASAISLSLQRSNPVLFAGAGVGCRVGFPTWAAFIDHLADVCEQYKDPDSAKLVRTRREQGDFLGAATVFKTSQLIPEGERWRSLSSPFRAQVGDEALDKLTPLTKLPFGAIVTTNYDRSLHDSFARSRGRWAPPAERQGLGAVATSREFFIARIHGNAEDATSMVVDAADYRLLRNDVDYLDFLLNVLSSRSCLFLGFSFLDPAIAHVLTLYAEKFGPTFPELHTALVPDRGNDDFGNRLRELNIETIAYDGKDAHADLWRAVRIVYEGGDSNRAAASAPAFDPAFAHAPIHKFFAFTFAQTRVRDEIAPVISSAQDGLVASLLASHSEDEVREDELVKDVAASLRVDPVESRKIVASALDRLAERDEVIRDKGRVLWLGTGESELDERLSRLAQDAIDRMRVRSGLRATREDHDAARSILERTFMTRAWDIAAHYAGGNSGWNADIKQLVRDAIDAMPGSSAPAAPTDALENAIHSLLTAPDTEEAELLTALGRAAFGTQLLFASPRQSAFHKDALPRILYFDANVLMPAMTVGHPLRPVYLDVLTRLEDGAKKSGLTLELVVGEQFLNEIVSHRRLAVEMVEAANLEDARNLQRHVEYYSAANTNVFVGAYSTALERAQKPLPFADFLARVAPFDNEEMLAAHLTKIGFAVVKMELRDEHNELFVGVLNPLKQAYEDLRIVESKPSVLVTHEAQQLARLAVDSANGTNSLFVTADRKLRTALATEPALKSLLASTVSHLGLIALTDVMVGLGRTLVRCPGLCGPPSVMTIRSRSSTTS